MRKTKDERSLEEDRRRESDSEDDIDSVRRGDGWRGVSGVVASLLSLFEKYASVKGWF